MSYHKKVLGMATCPRFLTVNTEANFFCYHLLKVSSMKWPSHCPGACGKFATTNLLKESYY